MGDLMHPTLGDLGKLLEALPEPALVCLLEKEQPARILRLNQSAARLLGSNKSKLKNQSFTNFIDWRNSNLKHIKVLRKTTLKCFLRSADKNLLPVELKISPWPAKEPSAALILIRDRSEEVKIKEEFARLEERYHYLTNLVTDYAYEFKVFEGGRLKGVWLSKSFYKRFGFSLEEIDARGGWISMVHPDDLEVAMQHARKVAGGQSDICEMRFLTKSGEARWLRDYAMPVFDKTGQRVIRIYGLSKDITEEKEYQQALKESEERFRIAFIASPDVLGITRLSDGKLINVNDGFCRISGYSREEVLGKTTTELDLWYDLKARDEMVRLLKEKGSVENFEILVKNKAGQVRHNLLSARTFRLKGEEYLLTIAKDVEELYQTQQALKAEVQRNELLLNTMLDGYLLADTEGKIIDANPAYCKMVGYSHDELLGMNISDIEAKLTPQQVEERIQTFVRDGRARFETKHYAKSGRAIDLDVSITMLQDERGPLVAAFVRDISELKQRQQKLQETRANLQALIDAPEASIWSIDSHYRYLIFNKYFQQAYHKAYGVKIKKGMDALKILSPKLRKLWKEKYDQALNGQRVIFEFQETIAGQQFVFQVFLNPIKVGRKITGVSAISQDITESKKIELELKESEERFRLAFHTSPDSVNINRLEDGLYVDINEGFTRITGYTREEVIGKTSLEINIWANPKDRQRLVEGLKKHGRVENLEAPFRMKDGTIVTGLMSAAVIHLKGVPHIISITRNIEHIKQLERERERLLAESEKARKLLYDVFERMTDGVVALDTNWRYTYLNTQAAKMLNREKPEDLLGKHIWTEYPEGIGQPFYKAYYKAMETQQPIYLEEYYEPWDRWFENRIYPSPEGLTIYFTEITERKLAERALRESEERFKTTFEFSSLGRVILSLEDRFLQVNQAFSEMVDISANQLLKLRWVDLVHEKDRPKYEDLISQLLQGRLKNLHLEHRLNIPNNRTIWVELNMVLVRDVEGQPAYFLGDVINVTDRHLAQEELAYRERLLSESQRIAHIGSWELDLVSNRLFWTEEIYRIFEFDPTQFEANYQAFLDRVHPVDRQMVDRAYRESVEQRTKYDIEHRLLLPDGRIKWVHEQCETYYADDGQPLRSIGTVLDITERKLAELALTASEARYRYLFENSPVPLWEEDFKEVEQYLQDLADKGITAEKLDEYFTQNPQELVKCAKLVKVMDVNQAALKLHEATSKKELLGALDKIFSEESYNTFKQELITLAKGKELFEAEGKVKTLKGEEREIFLRFTKQASQPGQTTSMAIVATMDITPLKQIQRALEQRLNELQLLYDLSLRLSTLQQPEAVIENALQLMLKAMKADAILFFRHENGTLKLAQKLAVHDQRKPIEVDLVKMGHCLCGLSLANGKPIFSKDIFMDKRCTLNACKKAGLRSFAALPLVFGEKLLGVVGIASREVRDFEKQRAFLETLINETTIALQTTLLLEELKRHEAELELLVDERTRELRDAIDELESFSYSVSHDLRAPLRAIDGFSRILAEEYVEKLDDEAKRLIGVVRRNTQRMGELIDDLLAFSRVSRQAIKPSKLNMTDMVHAIYHEITDEKQRAKIDFEIAPLPEAMADTSLMRQVWFNLLSNAIKFSAIRKVPKIKVGTKSAEDALVYFVQDNGVGFDMKYADKVFQIFQRLHTTEEFEGTGVGLSIVYRIINRHGGKVWVEAEKDKGATFYFSLPKVPEVSEQK